MSATLTNPLAHLPHGPSARFVTRIVEQKGDEIVCEGRLPAPGPYERSGRCSTFVLLELAAQAAALIEAVSAPGDAGAGSPRRGYLVRARSLRCARVEFEAGCTLRAWVRRTGALAPLFVYETIVSNDAGELFRGELSLYADPD